MRPNSDVRLAAQLILDGWALIHTGHNSTRVVQPRVRNVLRKGDEMLEISEDTALGLHALRILKSHSGQAFTDHTEFMYVLREGFSDD